MSRKKTERTRARMYSASAWDNILHMEKRKEARTRVSAAKIGR